MSAGHLSQACIDLDNLAHNLQLLAQLAGARPLWPTIKANAYGHGAKIIAAELVRLKYEMLCVAHVGEAVELHDSGIRTRLLVLSATLPEHADALVTYGCEVAICTLEMATALSRAAQHAERRVAVHVNVDTGMGRVGIKPEDAHAFIQQCRALPGLEIRGLMSHFARADEADKTFSLEQLQRFHQVADHEPLEVRHMANSAAIFDLAESHFDTARPGISIYGLRPSAEIANPRVKELRPVLEWKTRVTYLKEVPAGTGLSYGHAFRTSRPSLIATVPIGYGDGLSRSLSNDCELLVQGVRCPQVGRITMDQSLIDVTVLRGRVQAGDEVVIIGRQGNEEIRADELAAKLGTINYEIVTAIANRVPRVAIAKRSSS
jgi:alanine racemase